MTKNSVTDGAYSAALDRGRRQVAIEVITMRGGGFIIPRYLMGALGEVGASDLAGSAVWPDTSRKKTFFFEKKKQKTFDFYRGCLNERGRKMQKFFGSRRRAPPFFQKRTFLLAASQ